MTNFKKKLLAFTLAELLIIFAVMGVVAGVTIMTSKVKLNLARKYMYYATFMNLKQGVGEVVAQGFDAGDGNGVKAVLPDNWSTATTGFCAKLSDVFNTIGTPRCDGSVYNVGAGNNTRFDLYSFITTNGMIFYYNAYVSPSYQIIIDIDGLNKGSNTPNQNLGGSKDEMIFFINRNGEVLPGAGSLGAESTDYLSASVYNFNATTGVKKFIKTSVSYREALCTAKGDPSWMSGYCGLNTPVYNHDNTNCTTAQTCTVVINKPGP